jgi:thymidylate synthase ThyX
VERLRQNPELRFFADYRPELFTPEEEKILEPFFSNTNRPIFVASGLPEEIVGALVGRHSQSEKSMRRIFLDEYVKDPEMAQRWTERQGGTSGIEEFLDLERANVFLEKHFVGFGHDSLVASIPIIIGVERISQLGAKGIEDTRIGLSPIERSTRFGFFGKKVDGKYLYARSPVIEASPYALLYEETINAALDLYVQLQEPIFEAYKKKFPEASRGKIERMTFDATRVLLVAGNLTNLGALVDGQAAEHMIFKLKASELVEHQEIGQMLEEEIAKLAPTLVERIRGDFGRKAIDYLVNRQKETRMLAEEYLSGITPEKVQKGPTLISYDKEGENKVIAKIPWPESNLSDHQILKVVRQLSEEDKTRIIDRYIGQRPDRRSKPGRAFEEAVLSFQIIFRFAEWRDLQRNRIVSPTWRRLDYSLGVDVGEDLKEFGFGEIVEERLNRLAEAHSIIADKYPVEAQYMVAFGALMPYLITLNFRELVHIAELRTSPGTHQDYAKIASEMARRAKEVYPLLGKAFQFVNWR